MMDEHLSSSATSGFAVAPSFAAISDVHGNIWALEAVLADIRARGIGEIVNLGDLLYGPLDVAATFDRLIRINLTSIRGNCDRLLVESDDSPAAAGSTLSRNRSELTDAHRDWLRSLPGTLDWRNNVLLCHGTPSSDDVYLLENVDECGVRVGTAAEISHRLGQPPQSGSLVLCGHSHVPRTVELPNAVLVVNVGSVGLPAYSDDLPVAHAMEAGSFHARYAVLTQRLHGWQVEHIQVPYDREAAAALAERNGRSDWAQWIRTGRATQ